MKITENTTFLELQSYEALEPVIPYLMWNDNNLIKADKHLRDLQEESPTWAVEDMVYGLNRLLDIGSKERQYVYDVYGQEESQLDSSKSHVKLIHFPSKSKAFVILAAGGAYGAVCSLVEAFPVAAKLNELGISVFCLNYRVGPPELMPKPMDDLAAGYRFISANSVLLGVNPECYAVGGFSAGGHLAASWGTASLGYRKYGLKAPEVLFLDYPFVAMWKTLQEFPEEISNMMLSGYFGESYSESICRAYDIDEQIDSSYPPSYVVHAMDDQTVPIWNSESLIKAFVDFNIQYVFQKIESGGHGFGLGSQTDADEWVAHAVEFWQSLSK